MPLRVSLRNDKPAPEDRALWRSAGTSTNPLCLRHLSMVNPLTMRKWARGLIGTHPYKRLHRQYRSQPECEYLDILKI